MKAGTRVSAGISCIPVRAAGVARLASCRRGCGDVPVPGGEACELIPGAPVAPHIAAATTGGGGRQDAVC